MATCLGYSLTNSLLFIKSIPIFMISQNASVSHFVSVCVNLVWGNLASTVTSHSSLAREATGSRYVPDENESEYLAVVQLWPSRVSTGFYAKTQA